jgi:hypothetical protein
MSTVLPHAARIRELNDTFRRTLCGGKVFFSAGASALGIAYTHLALTKVRLFNDFGANNDPYGEHDFGSLTLHGEKLFWKIDCYDLDYRYGSEDPADPTRTCRVLTIMLAEEY